MFVRLVLAFPGQDQGVGRARLMQQNSDSVSVAREKVAQTFLVPGVGTRSGENCFHGDQDTRDAL